MPLAFQAQRAKHEGTCLRKMKETPTGTIHLLIVDSFPLSREGLKLVLSTLAFAEAQMEVTAADTLDAALAGMKTPGGPDVVLMSISTLLDAKPVLGQLRQSHPGTPVVAIVNEYEPEAVLSHYKRGVRAIIARSSPLATVLSAVRLVIAGGTYYPEDVIDMLCAGAPAAETAPDHLPLMPRRPERKLTRRQNSVLDLLRQGRSNHEISVALGLSLGTVKNHVTTVLKQLGARSRVEAFLLTRRPPPPLP